MEEIRIWNLATKEKSKPDVAPIEAISETATEQLLEDAITVQPELLMPNLCLIGRQNETAGGPLDLLGIDEDGRLVIIELKRGQLTREAVAQAIDYASYLADLESDDLSNHIEQNAGKGGTEVITSFSQWYQNQFPSRSISDIGTPRIVLVGLGVDERAKRMVTFLEKCELDISLITFHGFKLGQQTLLARQVEVQARSVSKAVRYTKQGNQTQLNNLLNKLGIQFNYEKLTSALRNGLGASAYQWPNPNGYSFSLPEITTSGRISNHAYVALYALEKRKGMIQVLLQPRAVEAVGVDALRSLMKAAKVDNDIKHSGYAELWISVDPCDDMQVATLGSLGEKIATAWKLKREGNGNADQNT